MTATIEDVAEQSGVSTATVSRALRGLPNVAPSTRERVLQAAEQLNYSIDAQASRLASGKAMTIGLVLPLIDQWFFAKVATSAETVLVMNGYDVLRVHVTSLEAQSQRLRKLISSRRVDGLITVTTSLSEHDIALLKQAKLPVVSVETLQGDFSTVLIDNVAASATATHHLLNLGHTDIALLGGMENDPMRFTIPKARRQGYLNALSDHGIDPRPELMISGNFSAIGGAEAMAQLLSIQKPPTAVFAMGDEMAIGAMKTIRGLGLRIPQDISVIGFDDHDLSRYLDLTTIQQPVMEFGERAAEIVLDHITNGNTDELPIIDWLDAKLAIRATTGLRESTN